MRYASCLEGYLCPDCARCEYWAGDSRNPQLSGIGCACTFPIDWCSGFSREVEREEMIAAILQHPKVCGWKERELKRFSYNTVKQIHKRTMEAVKENAGF